MDTLVASQTLLGNEIEKVANALYNDQPERKTLKYLKEKQAKLQENWQKFVEQDTEIKKNYSTEYACHQYNVTDYYNLVKKTYDKARAEIIQLINIIEKKNDEKGATISNDKDINSKVGDDIMKLIRNQRQSMLSLGKLLDNIKSVVGMQFKAYYSVKKELIQENWKEVERNQKIIWEKIDDPNQHDNEQYTELREKYQEVLIKLEDEQGKLTEKECPTVQMRLPKIQLPKFDGSYLKWQQFYDLFTQMIHTQPMGSAQKMFYLKSNLTGEAERLIRHITVSDENYQAAWEILNERYANKRLLVSALIDKLLSQPSITIEAATAIKAMHDTTKECIVGLENLGLKIYGYWDAVILHILTKKLDRNTHNLYEQSLKAPRELQEVKHFLDFLEFRFQALEALGHKGFSDKYMKQQMKVTFHTATEKLKGKCKNCNGPHAIYYCEKFLKLPPQERHAVIKKLNLCVNCLKNGHKADNCTSRSCLKCKQKHNTLLHGLISVHQEPTVHVGSTVELSEQHEESRSSYVFLGTAQALVEDAEGNMVKCRILLDSGSQVSFITERLRNKLKVTGKQEELNVHGIGETRLKLNGKINIKVKSRITKYETSIEAYVMKDITSVQPQQFVNISNWEIPKDVSLADPEFNKPGKIDVLLGAEVYGELMVNGQIKLNDDLPRLQNTTLGWIVLGIISVTAILMNICPVSR